MMAVAGGLLLSGCVLVDEVKNTLFDTRTVNLTESTYAAADMLAQQTKSRMTSQTPLRIAMLTDVATPYEVTAFGQQVANQLGSRFVQLGYNVQSVPLPPALMPDLPNTPVSLSPGSMKPTQTGIAPSMGKGEAMVTGTYARFKDTIHVSLKVLQAPDEKVIAAYDYTLPMTRDLRQTSLSEADRVRQSSQAFNGVFE